MAAPNGTLARLTRRAGAVTEALDVHEIESLRVVSFGGADTVSVHDLSGTGVTNVNADLTDFSVPGGQADTVIVTATDGPDRLAAADVGNSVEIAGLAARIRVTGAEPAGDRLDIRAQAGDDVVDSTRLSPARIRYQADGGPGNDTLRAGAGDDILSGSDGNDTLLAGDGNDVAFGDAGDDLLRGEQGHDTLDGGADFDTLIGGAGDDILRNGERVRDD